MGLHCVPPRLYALQPRGETVTTCSHSTQTGRTIISSQQSGNKYAGCVSVIHFDVSYFLYSSRTLKTTCTCSRLLFLVLKVLLVNTNWLKCSTEVIYRKSGCLLFTMATSLVSLESVAVEFDCQWFRYKWGLTASRVQRTSRNQYLMFRIYRNKAPYRVLLW